MRFKSVIYQHTPEWIEAIAKRAEETFSFLERDKVSRDFISVFFESPEEYHAYEEEFSNSNAENWKNEAFSEYEKLTDGESVGAMQLAACRSIYSLIRKVEPKMIVETGVCNGLSTLCILLALENNDCGKLVSIDYPYYADEALDEFQAETFDDYGGAAIPADKQPGWIVPDSLQERWTFIRGKSQRELPKLLTKVDELDLFIHDSEHSYPCMMFEYEIAYEWLCQGGILISDDILWNDAFEKFSGLRGRESGKITNGSGYLLK